ncbi:MAG: response regulator [Anaerolineales bacterium]|nr:response regulator [Anaerolineales bacterium]
MNAEQEFNATIMPDQADSSFLRKAVLLFQRITTPDPSLALEDQRKSAFFLSVLVGFLPIAILVTIVRVLLPEGKWALHNTDLPAILIILIISSGLYALGRSRAYFSAIGITFFIILLSIYSVSFVRQVFWPLSLLFILQLLSIMLLSPNFCRFVTAGMILINSIFSVLSPLVDPLDIFFGPTLYLILGLIIIEFYEKYSRVREQDQLNDLEKREQQSREFYARAEQQRKQLEGLTSVSQTLIELQDLESLLERIVEKAMMLLRCDSGGIYLLCEDEQVLEWVVARGDALGKPGFKLAKGEGLSGKVWELGKPMAVSSYSSWEGRADDWPCADSAVLAVPIFWREKLQGVLNIGAPYGRKTFSEDDLEILNQFASYTAIALHNSSLYQQIQMELHERKQAEEALSHVESRYQNLFNSVPVGLYRSTPDGKIVDMNQQWLKMLGYSLDDKGEVMKISAEEFFADPGARKKQIGKLFSRGDPQYFEVRLVRKDGRVIWVRDSSHLVVDPADGQEYFEGSLEDITAAKEADRVREELLAQIQQQAEQMLQIIRTVPEGVLLLNEQGVILEANPSGIEALAILAGKQKGQVLTELGDHGLQDLLTSPPKGLWHEIRTENEIYEVISRPLEIGPVTHGWVIVLRDVTMERKIKQRQQQQEQLAAIGQLAGGIAHDFNNILAVIALQSEMGLLDPGITNGVRDRVQIISKQTDVAADLIQQILDFSRQTAIELKDLNLVVLVREEMKLLERTISENIVISFSCSETQLRVWADPTRIRQVLLNLALNARDAMPDGGQLEFILDQVSYDDPSTSPMADLVGSSWARLRVRDTGMGILDKDLVHIFDPFYTTKEPGKGSGLGLAQVYGIMQQHNGAIHVESSFSLGTCFNLYLPLTRTMRQTGPLRPEPMLKKGRGQRVMVVEDNEATRSAIVSVLELLNYEVLQAENGHHALELYREWKSTIDVVLSDLVMPEMGGKALLYALKAQDPAVKVILLTGHLVQDDGFDFDKAGAAGWVQKPVSVKQIAGILADVLGTG